MAVKRDMVRVTTYTMECWREDVDAPITDELVSARKADMDVLFPREFFMWGLTGPLPDPNRDAWIVYLAPDSRAAMAPSVLPDTFVAVIDRN